MFERYSDKARHLLVVSREEASILNHGWVGTEHLLLALLSDKELKGAFPAVITHKSVRRQLVDMVGICKSTPKEHVPFTESIQDIMRDAIGVAQAHGRAWVDPEALALALMNKCQVDPDDRPAQIITKLDGDLQVITAEFDGRLSGKDAYRVATRDFICWFKETGSSEYPPEHAVSRLYEHLTE